MHDYTRGAVAGLLYDVLQEYPDGWQAILKTGGWAWVVDRVTSSYLDGAQSVGVVVLPLGVGHRLAA